MTLWLEGGPSRPGRGKGLQAQGPGPQRAGVGCVPLTHVAVERGPHTRSRCPVLTPQASAPAGFQRLCPSPRMQRMGWVCGRGAARCGCAGSCCKRAQLLEGSSGRVRLRNGAGVGLRWCCMQLVEVWMSRLQAAGGGISGQYAQQQSTCLCVAASKVKPKSRGGIWGWS